MNYDVNLRNLDELTATLRHWEDKKLPARDIQQVRDDLYVRLFGYTPDELVTPVSISKREEIKTWWYEQAVAFATSHGFDISSRSDHGGVPLPHMMVEYDWELDAFVCVEDYIPPIESSPETHSHVIRHWREVIEMMVAGDDRLLPETAEEIAAVKLQREARKSSRSAASSSRSSHNDEAELAQVFGTARSLRAGVIEPRNKQGKLSGRTVQVEVRRQRSVGPVVKRQP